MATDGSEHTPRMECERCGKAVASSQALQRHLESECTGGTRKGGGIIIGHENGEVEIAPKSPREMWMD